MRSASPCCGLVHPTLAPPDTKYATKLRSPAACLQLLWRNPPTALPAFACLAQAQMSRLILQRNPLANSWSAEAAHAESPSIHLDCSTRRVLVVSRSLHLLCCHHNETIEAHRKTLWTPHVKQATEASPAIFAQHSAPSLTVVPAA